MKYFYIVMAINENGKQYAYVLRHNQSNNLIGVTEQKNAEFAYLCQSKKEAERIASAWVESYKKNGTYMFDYA